MSLYGRILSAPTVERAIEAAVRAWLGDYLGETLRQAGMDEMYLPDPVDVFRVSEPSWPTEGEMNLVLVTTPGTVGDAERGEPFYAMSWDSRVAVTASIPDVDHPWRAREAAQLYAAAVGTLLAHKGIDLDGAEVRLMGESYDLLDATDNRTLAVGEARIRTTVRNARNIWGGPAAPTPDPDIRPPAEDDPEVDAFNVTITKEPIGQP